MCQSHAELSCLPAFQRKPELSLSRVPETGFVSQTADHRGTKIEICPLENKPMGWTTFAGPRQRCSLLDLRAGRGSSSLEREKPVPSPVRWASLRASPAFPGLWVTPQSLSCAGPFIQSRELHKPFRPPAELLGDISPSPGRRGSSLGWLETVGKANGMRRGGNSSSLKAREKLKTENICPQRVLLESSRCASGLSCRGSFGGRYN